MMYVDVHLLFCFDIDLNMTCLTWMDFLHPYSLMDTTLRAALS